MRMGIFISFLVLLLFYFKTMAGEHPRPIISEAKEILFYKKQASVFFLQQMQERQQHYLNRECQYEIKNNEFPLACYELIHLNHRREPSDFGNLDEYCLNWAKSTEQISQLRYYIQENVVSLKCKNQLKDQLSKLKYIKEWQSNCCKSGHEP